MKFLNPEEIVDLAYQLSSVWHNHFPEIDPPTIRLTKREFYALKNHLLNIFAPNRDENIGVNKIMGITIEVFDGNDSR